MTASFNPTPLPEDCRTHTGSGSTVAGANGPGDRPGDHAPDCGWFTAICHHFCGSDFGNKKPSTILE
jgi:hypothetical protein